MVNALERPQGQTLDYGSPLYIGLPLPIVENQMSVFLKIKLKSLAAESRIIRRQELKTRGKHDATRESLYLHRIGVVRRAARETHLAYGFIRGRSYKAMERTACVAPDWKAVLAMAKKYGTSVDNFDAWKDAA